MNKTVIALGFLVVCLIAGWFLLPHGSGKTPYSQQTYVPVEQMTPPQSPAPQQAPADGPDTMTPMP